MAIGYSVMGQIVMVSKCGLLSVRNEEVQSLVDGAYQRARGLLTGNQEKLELMAQYLIEKEVIDIDQAKKLLGMVADHSSAVPPSTELKGPQANA